jgi:DNA-binding LacI/PurR family transcriptional regulator
VTNGGKRVAVIFTQATFVKNSVSILTRNCIAGIRSTLSSTCSQVNLIAGKEVADQDMLLQHMLDEREIDGVILLGPETSDGYLRHLVRSGVAVVVLNRRPHHGEYSSVSVDYYGGGRQGIRQLIKLGHRKIALMVGSRKHWPSRELRQGALEAFARHGLEPSFDWHRKWNRSNFSTICDRVLASGATAFFTGGYPAFDATSYFESIGVSVPGDISVLGLDDLGLVSTVGRKMSAIGYDIHEQGCIAAKTLLRLMEERQVIKNIGISIRTKLVEGETIAAPRAGVAP